MIDKKKVKELLLEGKTLEEVGSLLGCTRANIGIIAKKLRLTRTEFGAGLRTKEERLSLLQEREKKYGRKVWELDNLGRARSQCFLRKKQNNQRWEWNITSGDIQWPTHCPILGIELDYFAEKRQENSPSFDRKDSTKGYIKGNVQIISWRANRIKNDGTEEEHRRIADFMRNLL